MQVIDIPSSPEPSSPSMTRCTRSASREPGPSKKRPRLAKSAREPSVVEIIELTDSDDDVLPVPLKMHDPPPGPSQPIPSAAPTFGKPNSEILVDVPAPQPGPSQHVARRGDDAPLFLPASDDKQHVIRPPPLPVAQHVPSAGPVHPQPVAPDPAPPAPVPVDPIDQYIVRVLEVVPDVQPTYALELIEQFMRSQPGNVVEFVVHSLFENPSYPKADRKGKHKRDESEGDPNVRGFPKPRVDYASKERAHNGGPHYFECSLEQLMLDFPRIPKPHIRARLFDNRFYAPTYLLLTEELKQDSPPFKLKVTNSVVGKGKGKTRQDPEFDQEREWILLRVTEMAAERDAELAAAVNEQEYEDNGEGIECGCCFAGYSFDQMIQCPEAHLFCKSCMTSYASTLLGEHNPNIICVDQSGCKLPFPESELSRFLPSKLLELYYRVKQRKEIEAAGLENLEECPFCEYKCVIENEMEKLFRCENAACSAITCRACKKPDHLPKSCKEMEEDKHLDAQHVIEEAMTQALMRNCPKCQKSFIKEMGCNKMTCPNCGTVSCYICRKIITGYDHFSNKPPPYNGKVDKSKCSLWDPIEQRHAEEVSEAAKRALAELRKSRPDVDESSLKLDIPVAKAPPCPGAAPGPGYNGVPGLPAFVGGGAPRMGGLAARTGAAGGAGMRLNLNAVPNGQGAGANPFMFGAGQAHAFNAMGFGPLPPGWGPAARADEAAILVPPIPPAQDVRVRRAVVPPVPPGWGLPARMGEAAIPAPPIPLAQDARVRRAAVPPLPPGWAPPARVGEAAILAPPIPPAQDARVRRAAVPPPPMPVPLVAQPQYVVAAGVGGRRRKGH